MKLSPAQKNELLVWEYFIPKNCSWLPKTDKDIEKFFEWSERGKHKEALYGNLSYFEALRQGKRWAGIHAHELFEPGVLSDMPYFVILGGCDDPMPRYVVDFLKKEMFKGADRDVIEKCYQSIL